MPDDDTEPDTFGHADTHPVSVPKSVLDAIRNNAPADSYDAARGRGRAVADSLGYADRLAEREAFAHGYAVRHTAH